MDAGGTSGVVVLLGGGIEVVVGRVAGGPSDLGVVEALARLQLEARRRGCAIRLRNASPELCELLGLVGLAGLIAGTGSGASVLEVGRQAEGGEKLGVQEAVETGDPPA